MLLPHITTKDANGAGTHKSWFPFPVLHLQSRDREIQTSPEPVLEQLVELSSLNRPLGDPSPSRGSWEDSGKYPWGSDLGKGELGPKPGLVHLLPSGAYCRSAFLLGPWAIFCVGKLMYGQQGINSPVKFWVNPQYFFQMKNWNFYFPVFNKKLLNGDVEVPV